MPDHDLDGASRHGASRPLAGVRVLSLAEQYPGPFATVILSDLGADVILVERPAGGDPTRRFSGHFAALNRGKRSVAIDLKNEQGVETFKRLSETADVVIEGFRPGVVERLGIGADDLRPTNPGLVYASISSFGQSGPLSRRASHDLSSQGMAGFVTDGAPLPLPIADLASGLFAAVGVIASLFARGRSGAGSTVDVSMLDALIALRSTALASSLNGLDPAPYPPLDPGYGVFETSEGRSISLSIAGEDHQWRGLCAALGLESIGSLTTAEREENAAELRAELGSALLATPWQDLEPQLESLGVGFGPVNSDHDVAVHPHVVARGIITEVQDGSGLRFVRQPIVFDSTPGQVMDGAPVLGQHTEELLLEIGLSPAAINSLAQSGAVLATERSTT
jgi:crotonobetainyl-CoA:carnitine CoA-transferase CaiB-like acyl-CoA transferase